MALAVQEAITEGAIAEGDGTITVVKWDVNAELTDSIFNNILSTMSGTDFGVFLYSPVDDYTTAEKLFGGAERPPWNSRT